MEFYAELFIRLVLASICGMFVGFERKTHHKQAGLKTFLIVSLGACLMMEVSKYGFDDSTKFDASRIASQVVSGISFLGAGIIMKRNQNVEGLSTAAGIWTMAGIGLALGAGMYFLGIAGTALYLFFNAIIIRIEKHNKTTFEDYVIVTNSINFLQEFMDSHDKNKILTFNVDKVDEVYNIELSIQFINDLDKQAFESRVLRSSHLISFEHK